MRTGPFGWLVVLAALWMRQAPATGDDDVAEERTIDRGTGPGRPSPRFALRRPHRRAAPHDAVEAYLAALVELSAVEPLSRAPDETPREHARRVAATLALDRGSGPERVTQIAVPLGRLALDYELVRFAARRVTTVEDRRAIGRWTSIRSAAGAMRRRSLPGGPALLSIGDALCGRGTSVHPRAPGSHGGRADAASHALGHARRIAEQPRPAASSPRSEDSSTKPPVSPPGGFVMPAGGSRSRL